MGKKTVLAVSALSSLALIASGAHSVYANGEFGLGDAEKDSVILPAEVQQEQQNVPEQAGKPETPPAQSHSEGNITPPVEKPEEPAEKLKKQEPKPEKPQPKQEPEPKRDKREMKASEPETHKDTGSFGKDRIVVSGKETSVASAERKSEGSEKEETKETESSTESKGDAQSDASDNEGKEEVKGQKMAKTGFNPLPFAQMAAGFFGLGGSALYGMRRKSTDD
ncbi:hypothetical protein [Kroppenstedtia guangzhouensis]|uniref:hypothetical protein n=1 Tax=Kroppenstedtia guangzhouensis TaxID=1274356 RepID=UPI00166A3426|nr:hypothetical protein [Kroppenstedtia guangzhouensis]